MLITLPSGLVGEARKIRGSEAIELAERAMTPNGNSLGSILRGTWQNTIQPGPYSHAEKGKPGVDWDRVLKGDLLAGLLTMRAASIPHPRSLDPAWPGARYEFRVQCEKCKKPYEWVVNDIVKDLPRRTLSPESVEKLRAGEPFTATAIDADGRPHELTFDLMLPEQDAVLRTLMKQLQRKRATAVESLATQTRSIDGQPKSVAARQAFFRELDLGELNRLRQVFDDADCGVDIDLLTTCEDPDCAWPQEVTLPFGRTFFRPDPERKPPTKTADVEDQK